jgi:hypothetical protein
MRTQWHPTMRPNYWICTHPESLHLLLLMTSNCCHRVNSSLNALSICPQEPSWVVIAGREGIHSIISRIYFDGVLFAQLPFRIIIIVLKILYVPDDPYGDIEERVNLRSGVRININYSSNDVKWANACNDLETFLWDFAPMLTCDLIGTWYRLQEYSCHCSDERLHCCLEFESSLSTKNRSDHYRTRQSCE